MEEKFDIYLSNELEDLHVLSNNFLMLVGSKTIEVMDSSQSIVRKFSSSVEIKDVCVCDLPDYSDTLIFVLNFELDIYVTNLKTAEDGDISTKFDLLQNMKIPIEKMFYCESKKALLVSSTSKLHYLQLSFADEEIPSLKNVDDGCFCY